MPSVRCPNCDTAQPVAAGSEGYTCTGCGNTWRFVVCRSCGSRFHARPTATTWTCPRCGLLQDASSEPATEPATTERPEPAPTTPTVRITDADLDRPQGPAGSAFPPGIGLGADDEEPQDAFAMPVRESSGRPVWVYLVGVVAALVVIVVLFNLFFGGDEPDTSGADGDGEPGVEQIIATMCGHVQQAQVFRTDALGEAAKQLRDDAAALREAGERQTARQVNRMVRAVEDLRRALAEQGDTTEPIAALQRAQRELPCN